MEKLIVGLVVVIMTVGTVLTVKRYNDCHKRGGELVNRVGRYHTVTVNGETQLQYTYHYSCTK